MPSSFKSLAKKRDIQNVLQNKEQHYRGQLLYFFARENRAGENRLAVGTPKKLGSAVQRNRVKRQIKAAFQAMSSGLNKSLDILIYPQAECMGAKTAAIREELGKMLKRG